MSQPAKLVPRPPQRSSEAQTSESVRTVNAQAPTDIAGSRPTKVSPDDKNGKAGDEDKKKKAPGGWKEKMAAKSAEMAAKGAEMAAGAAKNAAAGAANLNAAVVAGGENLRNRLNDGSSDDDEDSVSSDEETEDIWNSTPASTTSTAPNATAIAIRNQPAVNFITIEEEERIKAELKDAKNLRKKLRKMKKCMKKSTKAIKAFSEANEAAVAALYAATNSTCTDQTIIDLASGADKRLQETKESGALTGLSTHITDQILEQTKPINDHAKMISVTGKERRAARDRRIRLVLGQVDVTNEEEYNRSVDVVRDFEEKDRTYKDEFINFREHNSSQLGLMLRSYLLENASYLEAVARAMREAASGATNNYYLSNDCCTKFKDFKVDQKFLAPIPPLFSNINAHHEVVDDRLTAKPQPHPPSSAAEGAPVAGIPMTDTSGEGEGHNGYGASAYTRPKDSTRVRRGIDDFLLTGQLPPSEKSRASPSHTQERDPVKRKTAGDGEAALPDSVASRARPTSVFGDSPTTKSLRDYIHSLADEYGIEPDFSVRRSAAASHRSGSGAATDSGSAAADADEDRFSQPPSVVPQAKSVTPHGSFTLPSLTGSARASAPSASPTISLVNSIQ